MFNTPIPGQSLTSEPGNQPWEKPSQIRVRYGFSRFN